MAGIDAGTARLGERVGSFRFLLDGERWEWSDEVARMHGYEPGTVLPTTQLVLSHKYTDDNPPVTALIDNLIRRREPFSCRHRIIDTRARTRVVVVVGDVLVDDTGDVIGTEGFYVDVTDSYESDVERRIGQASKAIVQCRAQT